MLRTARAALAIDDDPDLAEGAPRHIDPDGPLLGEPLLATRSAPLEQVGRRQLWLRPWSLEIEAYQRGEREQRLNWAKLQAFSGFSDVSLWKKPAIKGAVQAAQQAMRADATPTMRAPRTTDEPLPALQATIEKLQGIVRAYDEQRALYEYNLQRLGLDPDELRKPLDPLARDTVRSRRMKAVR